MAHHGTYTSLGCRWLTTGLTHTSDADGAPRHLHTPRMRMAHHGSSLGCRWLTTGLSYTRLRCPWLTMGLNHYRHLDADGSPRDLHTSSLGCRWLTTGLTNPSNAVSSPWELHTPREPMAHHETHTLHNMPMAHHRTYTQPGYRCLTTGLTHNSPAGSTSVRAPDNMDNYLVPLSHTVLPITLSTTTTTYAQVPSLGFQTQIETPCNQQTTYGVSSWFTLCISPPPSSSG